MVAVVSGLRTELCCRNKPCKTKLGSYHFTSHWFHFLKQLYMSKKAECFRCRGVHGRPVHIEAFKEELAWATDKRLRIISNII